MIGSSLLRTLHTLKLATMHVSWDYYHGDFKNVNTLELNSNILNIIPTRTITYDYNGEGARTKKVNLARRRTRMLYSSFGLRYI